jgi:hypothetical protein
MLHLNYRYTLRICQELLRELTYDKIKKITRKARRKKIYEFIFHLQ